MEPVRAGRTRRREIYRVQGVPARIRHSFIHTVPLAGGRGRPWRAGTSREEPGVPDLLAGRPRSRERRMPSGEYRA